MHEPRSPPQLTSGPANNPRVRRAFPIVIGVVLAVPTILLVAFLLGQPVLGALGVVVLLGGVLFIARSAPVEEGTPALAPPREAAPAADALEVQDRRGRRALLALRIVLGFGAGLSLLAVVLLSSPWMRLTAVVASSLCAMGFVATLPSEPESKFKLKGAQ